MLSFTQPAREKVRSISEFLERPALRIHMGEGASPLAPEWEFLLVEEADAEEGDTVIDADGVRVILDARTASQLRGRMVDYGESGFLVRFPSWPSVSARSSRSGSIRASPRTAGGSTSST